MAKHAAVIYIVPALGRASGLPDASQWDADKLSLIVLERVSKAFKENAETPQNRAARLEKQRSATNRGNVSAISSSFGLHH